MEISLNVARLFLHSYHALIFSLGLARFPASSVGLAEVLAGSSWAYKVVLLMGLLGGNFGPGGPFWGGGHPVLGGVDAGHGVLGF